MHQPSVTRQLIVRNTGERPGTINFAPSAGANKFNVQPASGVATRAKNGGSTGEKGARWPDSIDKR